jgi:hypothetical protein
MVWQTAQADTSFFVHRLDGRLRTVGQAAWRAPGAVVGPVHVTPRGEVVALSTGGGPGLTLRRWTADGQLRDDHVVALPGRVLASRLAPGETLVVVTEEAVARVGLGDGRVLARVPPGLPASEAVVGASPGGAWFALPDRLVYVGLDGRRTTRPLPLGVPAGPRNRVAGLLATDRETCVLAEARVELHPVSGREGLPDRTFTLVLTLADPDKVLATAELGALRTRREWFWIESGGEGPIPRGAGLVRTRYHGGVEIHAAGQAGEAGYVLLTLEDLRPGEGRRSLVGLDPSLRPSWGTPFGGGLDFCETPAVASGVLVRSGPAEVRSYDLRGGSEQVGALRYPDSVGPLELARVALGRDEAEHWLVVAYGEAEPAR